MAQTLDECLQSLPAAVDALIPAPDFSGLAARLRRRTARRRAGAAAGLALTAGLAAGLLVLAQPDHTPAEAGIYRALACPDTATALPPRAGDADRLRRDMDRIVAAAYGDPDHANYVLTGLALAPDTPGWGAIVQAHCAPAVYRQTWVVQLHFPKLEPSASLSQGQIFVTRTRAGFATWSVYH